MHSFIRNKVLPYLARSWEKAPKRDSVIVAYVLAIYHGVVVLLVGVFAPDTWDESLDTHGDILFHLFAYVLAILGFVILLPTVRSRSAIGRRLGHIPLLVRFIATVIMSVSLLESLSWLCQL